MAGSGRRRVTARLRTLLAVFALVVVGSGMAPGEPAWAARPAPEQVLTAGAPADTAAPNGATTYAPTPNGVGTIATGTFDGKNSWDFFANPPADFLYPGYGYYSPLTPTVTVDQTSNLTNQMVKVSWTNFTPSFYFLNGNPQNGFNPGSTYYGVTVYECKGTAPQDRVNDCNYLFANSNTSAAGAPPTAVDSYTQAGTSTQPTDCSTVPANDTVCGAGFTYIQVQTFIQNSELGCGLPDPKTGQPAACSIVVVPLWGGTPSRLTSEPDSCEDHASDFSFDPLAGDKNDGESNVCAWQNRIVVPVNFAPTPKTYCSTNYQFSAEGSPSVERLMAQWQPAWCTASQNKVNFNFDSGVDEYLARTHFLGGGSKLSAVSDAALVTDPASADQTSGSPRKFTYAPISNTGIVVAYYVDNGDLTVQQPITNLVLNARLVAKMLTQSYSLQFNQCAAGQTVQSPLCDPAVAGNPTDIFEDPEFQQLNPEYPLSDFNKAGADAGNFLPIVAAGNSDMTYELTRWVESDPEARAFLDGQPDPWGMHINTYYELGQTYPASQFSVVDPGYTMPQKDFHLLGSAGYPYNVGMQDAWIPLSGLDSVAAHLANWTPSELSFSPVCLDKSGNPTACGPGVPVTNPKAGPEPFPGRTLFAVMDQGTAAAYRFPTAQLVNPAGNAVAPTYDAESAALASMQTNPDKITQYQDFTKTSANAYPLAEVQYAMVPTCGLTQPKVAAVSAFLQNVADSQHYGNQVGQVPPFGGYFTLNNAQKAQTLNAAQQVSSQSCTSPPPDHSVSGQNPPPATGTPPPTPPANLGGGGAGTPSSLGGHSITSTPSSGKPTPGKSASSPQQIKAIDIGQKSSDDAGLAHYMLPVILILGAVLLLGGPLTYAFSTGALRLPPVRRRWPAGGSGPSAGGPGAANPPAAGDPTAGGSEGVDG